MAPVMVPFTNGKGGVGKTALACSYAVARAREGADVVLMDVNEEQRTATAWCEVRDHNSLLPKIRVEAGNPRQALEMVGRCYVLIVDTPGWTDKSTLALAKRSTFMVIPTGPNPTYDLAATVRLLHGLTRPKASKVGGWVWCYRASPPRIRPGVRKSSSPASICRKRDTALSTVACGIPQPSARHWPSATA